jgi:hypothetical protein
MKQIQGGLTGCAHPIERSEHVTAGLLRCGVCGLVKRAGSPWRLPVAGEGLVSGLQSGGYGSPPADVVSCRHEARIMLHQCVSVPLWWCCYCGGVRSGESEWQTPTLARMGPGPKVKR